MTSEEVDALHLQIENTLKQAFEDAKNASAQKRDWLTSYWSGFKSPDQLSKVRSTGIPLEKLKQIGERITHVPEDLKMHRGVKKVRRRYGPSTPPPHPLYTPLHPLYTPCGTWISPRNRYVAHGACSWESWVFTTL
eukprot:7645126-Pyramimonas_sp.AAC.1